MGHKHVPIEATREPGRVLKRNGYSTVQVQIVAARDSVGEVPGTQKVGAVMNIVLV